MSSQQNYANHARFVPLYHYVLFLLVAINLGWQIYRLSAGVTSDAVVAVIAALALVLTAFYARAFALRAQDRVIRLEMQLRMRAVLPSDLQARIPEFSLDQLVGLRFASDEELPALAAKALDENIQDRKTIKQLVVDWQADDLRV